MKFGSLFTGVGGFDLAFERAGMECAWQVEFDKSKRRVLEQHYPNTLRITDVREAGSNNLGAVDLICGGFPCQDLSVAGRRAGLAGERSGLWFEFHRIITELLPEWVVIENVPGLLSSNQGRDFAVVLAGLTGFVPRVPDGGWKNAGFIRGNPSLYRVAWRVLDAQYFNVPQRRKRVFIIAHLRNGSAASVLFESASRYGDFEPRREARQGTAAPTEGSAGGSQTYRYTRYGEFTGDATASALRADAGGQTHDLVSTFDFQRSGEYGDASVASTLASRDYKSAKDLVAYAIDVRNLESNGDISGTLQSKSSGYSLNYTNPIAFNWNAGASASLSLGETTGTLRTRHHNHPAIQSAQSGVRRLTPTECARLQGFPDDWCAMLSDSEQYRAYGDAVCVNVAEWIGRRIVMFAA